jgi:hypothetical protein
VARSRVLTVTLAAFLLLAILVVGIGRKLDPGGDPLPLLERPRYDVAVAAESTAVLTTASGESRLGTDYHLRGADVGDVHVSLSLPADLEEDARLPIVVVLGGLDIGRKSLGYIPRHGRNALLAYQYPYSPRYWYDGSPLTELPAIRTAALSVPAQVAAAIGWAGGQSWADPDRISLLGYSFGAFFVPATWRVTEASGSDLKAVVIAYGGADLGAVMGANLGKAPAVLRPIASRAVALALAPMEPARHLPHLHDPALLLNGSRDTRIPEESVRMLRDRKPDPKTILEIDAGHMHRRNPELTGRIVALSRGWLMEQRVIEP